MTGRRIVVSTQRGVFLQNFRRFSAAFFRRFSKPLDLRNQVLASVPHGRTPRAVPYGRTPRGGGGGALNTLFWTISGSLAAWAVLVRSLRIERINRDSI